MDVGQMFWCASTMARFEVEAVDGDRAIARGARNGGRVMIGEQPGGHYLRSVTDNGQSGATLFASLEPVGPRYAVKAMSR